MPTNQRAMLARDSVQHAQCVEQMGLINKIVDVVRCVHEARGAINQAIKEKRDFIEFAKLLAVYRVAEREAVRALDEHRRDHGC
jgi:hypothetical protein